jgi:hypothetical protein
LGGRFGAALDGMRVLGLAHEGEGEVAHDRHIGRAVAGPPPAQNLRKATSSIRREFSMP